jgi:hypothetical protein
MAIVLEPSALILVGVGLVAFSRIARKTLTKNEYDRPQAAVFVPRLVVYQRPELLSSHKFEQMSAEAKARRWLFELIPSQARAYKRTGQIEIPSTLYPELLYRINRDRITEIFEDGIAVGTAGIHTLDPLIPPTDRALAEYFLLKGDESSYLKIAIFCKV